MKWNVELDAIELVPYQMKLASINTIHADGNEENEILLGLTNECKQLLELLTL